MTDPITHPATGALLAPTVDEIMRLRLVAGGREPPDLVVRGGRVLALHTGELLERDVVVAGRHIAALTPHGHVEAPEVVDARGLIVAPTFIDAHLHIEYTKLVPGELARLSVPRGTTTVLADANCMANVLGQPGMDAIGRTDTPLRILWQVSHKVPQTPLLETGGASLATEEIAARVQRPEAATLGESNPFSLDRDSARKQVAALAAGKRITGHTALLENEPLWAYLAGGIGDDHNAFRSADVVERLRLGALLTVMSGSMNCNVAAAFADLAALGAGLDHMAFCADDKLCEDLDRTGHIDHHVRRAIAVGVPPVAAYRMATLVPARHYRIDHLVGLLAPSRLADLQLLPDLAEARPSLVMVGGRVVARDGRPLFGNADPIPAFARGTVRPSPRLDAQSFAVRANGRSVWVQGMEMYDGYWKRAFHAELPVEEGRAVADTARDVLKVAVVDRHHASDEVGVAYVRGFGLQRGALACSTNCENGNIVVVATSDEEAAAAVRAVEAVGGGYAVVAGGEVLATVPLPVAGLMSDRPWEEVIAQSLACDEAARAIGCTMHAPFLIMSFVGLVGVPDLGLTERGLVDVRSQSFIDVVLQVENGIVQCRCPAHAHPVHALMDPATHATAGAPHA